MTTLGKNVVPFHDLEKSHLEELACIHIDAINYSLNARLGHAHLMNLYTLMQRDKDVFGLVYLREGKAVGLCLGTTNLKSTQHGLTKINQGTLKFLTNPFFLVKNLGNILDYLAVSIVTKRISSKSNCVLLWFVEENSREFGYGKKLLEGLVEIFAIQNNLRTFVDVRKSSINAIKSYQKFGFKVESSTMLSWILIRSTEELIRRPD